VIVRQALAALLVWGGLARAQRPAVHVVDPGLGAGPQILEHALAGPHVLIPPAEGRALLPRDSTYPATVIVIGREAAVEGTVNGDVIVVGGDLHVHPHATVNGRAIAIGGGVYPSAMATIASGIVTFREFTYVVRPVPDGYELRYRSLVDRPSSSFALPGIYGFRVPSYDRTDGLAAAFAPLFDVPGTPLLVEPKVTYRSQLGRVDPSGSVILAFDSRTRLDLTAGQATFSNDRWIWPELVNGLAVLGFGEDSRNYYRATRADASLSRRWAWTGSELTPYVGARWERAESARPDSTATSGPWAFSGRASHEDMLRPNPPIDSGTIISGVLGARFDQRSDALTTRTTIEIEAGGFSPQIVGVSGTPRSFAQATLDGGIAFPTFGTQSLQMDAHVVASWASDPVNTVIPFPGTPGIERRGAPRQRWAYVGGWGSIPTLSLLERGGDELIYLDGRYNVPIDKVQLPFIGAPVVSLRSILAGADVQRWPSLAQAVGIRLSVSTVYGEWLIDPANRHNFFGAGLSIAR
jgi:hypothetical protein